MLVAQAGEDRREIGRVVSGLEAGRSQVAQNGIIAGAIGMIDRRHHAPQHLQRGELIGHWHRLRLGLDQCLGLGRTPSRLGE
jgi:hypothetical protein